ncbi:hypothetical protein K491DRAFT_247048 [Lophiostoma macrostomum CBS 122681]|uniref:Uncharacterized protein n=1 Tax=Lophiostoma macrostomum CBS 122681 TaxID=1314788 RepID=A0A6A6TH72_9PLEO|nr:hypothetical protein K491DRAFT_247048 [Lophiostoma macrostomum CBS 122681]
MSDIEKAFTFLHDNIPSWFVNLTEIEEKLVRMQSAMAEVPASRSPPLRKKTGSVESIRDLDLLREGSTIPLVSQPSPSANRKRKTPSVASGRASGPIRYRSRNMIIVQYDGEIQKQFESLVRSIGTGRNMLRKGSEDDDDQVVSKIGYRHRAGLSSMRALGMMAGESNVSPNTRASPELFDTTDKSLEQAQGLCEKAAHQSLRDGDCRKELSDVRKHCKAVLDAATDEVAKYKARKEKEAEDAKSNPLRKHSEPEVLTAATTPELFATGPSVDVKPMMPSIKSAPAAIPTSKGIDIEIDDDEDDDMDFVMPPIRLTSRA